MNTLRDAEDARFRFRDVPTIVRLEKRHTVGQMGLHSPSYIDLDRSGKAHKCVSH